MDSILATQVQNAITKYKNPRDLWEQPIHAEDLAKIETADQKYAYKTGVLIAVIAKILIPLLERIQDDYNESTRKNKEKED